MLPDRVGALIVKNKKLLLVTGKNAEFFWTPGGKIDERETHEVCLQRELQEELGIAIHSSTFYKTFIFSLQDHQKQTGHYYFINFKGKLRPSREINKIYWFSRRNFISGKPAISQGLREQIIPQLIEDGLL